MEETNRKPRLGAVLGILATVLAAAALWAASAFAAGGSASSEPAASDGSPAASVEYAQEAPDGDCPERENDSGESANA